MSKLDKFKEAMKNPPPERLAKIEFRSHFMQMLGVSIVCTFLIIKGFWYIIFAFIFGLGVSYSQGMNAYQKYLAIMEIKSPEKLEEYEKDISFTRRRSKIIKSVMGSFPNWASIILAVGAAVMLIDPTISRWLITLAYPVTIFTFYIFLYFGLFYWVSYPIYKKKISDERRLKK